MRFIDADKLIKDINKRYNEKKGIVSDTLAEGFMQMEKLIKEQDVFDLADHDKQVRDEVIEEMVKEIDDVDMDSNYIYLKFDKEKYDIPNQITRKSELKDWVLEQMKGEK